MSNPQSARELKIQLGKFILTESIKAIGHERDLDMAMSRAADSAHIEAAETAKKVYRLPLRPIVETARRAREAMGNQGDINLVLISIVSDMSTNPYGLRDAFAQPPLGYFRQVYSSLLREPENAQRVLDAIVEFGQEE